MAIDLLDPTSADGGGDPNGADASGAGEAGVGDAALDEAGQSPGDSGQPFADAQADATAGGPDASTRDAALGDGALSDAASSDAGASDAGLAPCDLSGTWAVKLEQTLSWPASFALAGGSGDGPLWMLFQLTHVGSSLTGTIALCGVTVPDFLSSALVGDELYGLTLPTSLFDHVPAYLPTTAASFVIGGSTPGSAISLSDRASVFGATMANPLTDPWPAAPTSVDMDMDGKPGITASYKAGANVQPPVNTSRTTRAQTTYLAARFIYSLAGTLTSCTQMSGPATVSSYDTHILGCRIAGAARDCTLGAAPAETGVLDSARPVHTSSNASYTAMKVANGATCAAIRGALP